MFLPCIVQEFLAVQTETKNQKAQIRQGENRSAQVRTCTKL